LFLFYTWVVHYLFLGSYTVVYSWFIHLKKEKKKTGDPFLIKAVKGFLVALFQFKWNIISALRIIINELRKKKFLFNLVLKRKTLVTSEFISCLVKFSFCRVLNIPAIPVCKRKKALQTGTAPSSVRSGNFTSHIREGLSIRAQITQMSKQEEKLSKNLILFTVEFD